MDLDFIKYTNEIDLYSKELYYDYLSEHGRKELDFIIIYFGRNLYLERLSFIAHIINILFIFMPEWESFSAIKIMLDKSRKIKNSVDDNNSLRW